MERRRRTRGQQQRALLTRNGTTITRDNGSVAYVIYCAKCDYQNFAINAGGRMSYKQALALANKHFCGTLNFNENQA
jgi:hypothetical protein